jgi:hypothetical protein
LIAHAVFDLIPDVAGKLPATAGWQPALPECSDRFERELQIVDQIAHVFDAD